MPFLRSARARAGVGVASAMLLAAALSGCTSTTAGRLADGSGSATSPTGGASSSSAPVAPAQFSDCSSNFNLSALGLPSSVLSQFSFDCATVPVPLNYDDLSQGTISIAIVRVHRSGVKPVGQLLVNPGGPGASGIELALGLVPQLDDTLLEHFDLIGFDPRGVGSSSPITCLTDAQKDTLNAASPDILTASGFAAAKQMAADTASLCSDKYGSKLADYNTVFTARDMDRIRRAVGDSRMNYLGFSYGTELGAQYAHLFPTTIRAMVLDGAVDPLTSDITTFANQLQGFEGAFDQFAAYCVKTAPCSSLGNPRQAVYRIAAAATKSPIPSTDSSEPPKATSSLVYTGVLSALYSKSQWPTLGEALISAEHGSANGILSLADQYNERYDGHYTNIADANLTIGCNDSKPGPSDATIKATAVSWATRFPMFGLTSAPSLFSCQDWQPRRTVPPLPTASSTPNKVLVIGNLHDPATPYQGAKDLTNTLGNAELLSWNGEGHTSYLQGSSCIDNDVNAYLETLTLPKPNTLCPA